MSKTAAIKRGEKMGKWALGFYRGADLAAWGEEQGRKSDAAAARGEEADAAMYAAAYVTATR